ncbi:MAG TPA: hypothetical protein ENK57_14545 [Polyangiaceae bacterium]|nr:hypothetical protein [Polyangiaceae bacterium]
MSVTGGLPVSAPWLALAVVASLAAVGPAGAQDDRTRARELFVEGRRDVARGDLEAACDKFARSHDLAPEAVGPLLNLADCDERAGKVATAWRRLARAAELADDEAQRAYARRRVEALADRVPWLTLQSPAGGPAEITVERDGEPVDLGDSGGRRALDPGRYIIVVRASGRSDRRYEIDLREGEDRAAVLELGPALTPAPAPSPEPSFSVPPPPPLPPPRASRDDGSGSLAVAGWVVGGVGVAALTVGIATGIAVGVDAGTYDDHCDAQDRCDAEGLAAAERGKPLAVVSPVMLALGLVGIGVALPLLFIDDDAGVQVAFTPQGVTLGAAF